ncbi:hypothetical protein SK128_012355, partial [Halocaridina rubra]
VRYAVTSGWLLMEVRTTAVVTQSPDVTIISNSVKHGGNLVDLSTMIRLDMLSPVVDGDENDCSGHPES